MAWELIYTSAPRGLRAGASGYCTVAQTIGLREDLAAALERRSLFTHEPKGSSPPYFSFRNLSLGGETWRVLTRALDAGLDFTGRRHFLAHHLVLEAHEETSGIQPVDFLLGWKGWRDRWQEAPQELAKIKMESFWNGVTRIGLPAREWKRVTGDAGWAVQPHQLASPVGWLATDLSAMELLRLMGESTALLEAGQRGKSWLVPLEVGGPANPVAKDSLWSGRVSWRNPASPSGVRSVLRIDQCLGAVPSGRAEEIILARTGELSKTTSRNEGAVAESSRRELVEMPGEPRAASPSSRRRNVLYGMALALLVGVGLGWWGLGPFKVTPLSDSTGEAPLGVKEPAPMPPAVSESSSPTVPQASIGEALRQKLWQEAGGQESVSRLHLLFDRRPSQGDIEKEIELLLREGADPSSVRGPEGLISLAEKKSQENFAREASKRTEPWTVFFPKTRLGLAYLPDPAENGQNRRLAAQGLSPKESLEEIARRIFLASDRWALLIRLPPWGDKQFMPVEVVGGEDDQVWLERLDQHRVQLRKMRLELLRRLTPWLGQDPSSWDEEEIRKIAQQIPGGPAAGVFDDFKRLDDEIRRWWLPPDAAATPGSIFRKVLEHPGTVCELQLDKLAIGRVVP